jgi:radical SAM superfamily enzyme YgiQ (UPF0313 family)
MKILLAGPDFEENLSIRYLSSSLLAAGHDTTLAPFNSAAEITTVADAAQHADIVGLSMCFQSRAKEFLNLAQLLKQRNPNQLVVAGGHYVSCAAEPLLAHHPEIDIIVIHEGERTLVEIADDDVQRSGGTPAPNPRHRLSRRPARPLHHSESNARQPRRLAIPRPPRPHPHPCRRGYQLHDGQSRMLWQLRLLLHHHTSSTGSGQALSSTQRGRNRR